MRWALVRLRTKCAAFYKCAINGFGVGGLGRGGGALCRSLARGRMRQNRAPNDGAQMKGDRAEQRDNRLPDSATPEAGAGGG